MNRCAEFARKFFLFSFVFVLTLISQFSPESSSGLHSPVFAQASAGTQLSTLNLTETRLAAIPEDYQEAWDIVFSADGKQVAYKARKGDKEFVVVGNKADGKFYDTMMDSILLSSDGQRAAYHGRRKGKSYLVIDGKEAGPYDDAGLDAKPRGISPDNRLLAAQVQEKGKWFNILFDWKREIFRSSGYVGICWSPIFSPDSRLVLYLLADREGKILLITDVNTGKIKKRRFYDSAEDFVFTPDGSRLAHKIAKEGKSLLVLHDFTLNKETEVILPYVLVESLSLSSTGQRIAYTAGKEGKAVIAVSDWDAPSSLKEYGPYDGIDSVVFSPDGKQVAYLVMKEGKWFAAVGEKEGQLYDGVGQLSFSPDGSKIVYRAIKEGKRFIVVGPPGAEKKGPAYDMVISPIFSPDGSKIVYRARRGTQEKAERFIVIADKDGRVLKEGPICDEVWEPVFSADGKFVAYGARIGRELWWKVQTLP